MKSKIILFDFDGTIADTLHEMVRIYNALAEKHHFRRRIENGDIKRLRGFGVREIQRELGIPWHKIPSLLAEGRKMMRQNIKQINAVKDMPYVFGELEKKGYELFVLTSNAKETVEEFLLHHDIRGFKRVYSETSLFGKGRILKKIMRENSWDNGQVVYVGDEVRDIEAAKKAGIRILAVTWGLNSREALFKARPDSIVDNPRECIVSLDNI